MSMNLFIRVALCASILLFVGASAFALTKLWSTPVFVTIGSRPTIQSCDQNGVTKNEFNLTDTVYAVGSDFGQSTTYDFYLVEDVNWTHGMFIPSRILGTATTVSSDASGDIPATPVWASPLTMGEFDMIVDVNGNGQYDYGTDALDNSDKGTAGLVVIPEFSSFLILPLTMIATLLAVIAYRRKQADRR